MTKFITEDLPEGLPNVDFVAQGVHNGIRWFISQIDRTGGSYGGPQHNGYIELPDGHPLNICNAGASGSKFISVHGGVTYESGNIIGFDTSHWRDTAERWPLDAVRAETISFAQSAIDNNTDENKAKAAEFLKIRDQITELKEQAESLGFDSYDLI